ncbi:hypothetical protein O1F49_002665 [Enterococcus hirae]|nr:hypothetical protein [Enterococcus hirae]
MLSEKLKSVFEQYNGTLPSKIAFQYGIDKETLRKAYLRGDIERHMRGVYNLTENAFDEMFALQSIYSKGVYSHESALYLHFYGTNVSHNYVMTFPEGYHASSLKNSHIIVYNKKIPFYQLGISSAETMVGNKVYVYDKEKTILDMLSSGSAHEYDIREMLEEYKVDEEKNINRLINYAEILGQERLLERVFVYC